MTPKEKAEKLYWKFVKIIDPAFGIYIKKDAHKKAKQCALIAVDEMIGMLPFPEDEWHLERLSFLEEVKKEIEQL